MQKRRDSIANALESRLFCIKVSIWRHSDGQVRVLYMIGIWWVNVVDKVH